MRRVRFDAKSFTIAERLREWDFLGVYADPTNRPEDDEEYDDLVDPLREWLEQGFDAAQLSANLTAFVEKNYGSGPESPLAALDLTQPLHDWWASDA